MREVLDAQECADLQALWRCRSRLLPAEMARLYNYVQRALQSYTPPELQILGEGRQELIAQFIYSKILRLDAREDINGMPIHDKPDDGHSAPSSTFALCAYFRRYLIDCTRSSAVRKTVSLDDETSGVVPERMTDAHQNWHDCLIEHGLDPRRVSESARAFIAGLAEPERRMLCEGFGREEEGGLSAIAARHRIASYHYRAGRLGIVHRRQASPRDFAHTQLGHWLEGTLGIRIEAANMPSILAVFRILGAEAACA